MSGFSVIRERLELKYLIDEPTAGQILREIAPFCAPDPFNPARGGYPIYSVYLDTPSLAFHRAKLRDDATRMKLRVRTYDLRSGDAYLEIKRKIRDVIHKTRVGIPRDQVERAAHGLAEPLRDNPTAWRNLSTFAHHVAVTGAEPRLVVAYEREAYVSAVDTYARVTLDRRLQAWPARDGWGMDLTVGQDEAVLIDGAFQVDGLSSPVVLELKCERLMPNWMVRLIQRHALRLRGFSKYSYGIGLDLLQEQGLRGMASIRGEVW